MVDPLKALDTVKDLRERRHAPLVLELDLSDGLVEGAQPDPVAALMGARRVHLRDVLDGLGLGTVNLFGVSWGGFVARLAASTFPDRARRLALLVPAGIASGSVWKGLTRMAVPAQRG